MRIQNYRCFHQSNLMKQPEFHRDAFGKTSTWSSVSMRYCRFLSVILSLTWLLPLYSSERMRVMQMKFLRVPIQFSLWLSWSCWNFWTSVISWAAIKLRKIKIKLKCFYVEKYFMFCFNMNNQCYIELPELDYTCTCTCFTVRMYCLLMINQLQFI